MEIKSANTPLEKLIGLIGKKNIQQGITFKTRLGIHTLFMREPIDVLLLDENHQILAMRQNLSPWRIWIWGTKTRIVVELPAGFIKKKNLLLL